MAKFLLENGASPNESDNEGRSCIHVIATLGYKDQFTMLTTYYSQRLNINQADNNGSTPLHTACWHDQTSIAELILANAAKLGLNINQRDKQGATPLSIASQKGNLVIVHELLRHNANVFASSRNPIKLAMQGGFNEIVKLLQLCSAKSYQEQQAQTQNNQTADYNSNNGIPRNSKSLDSIKAINSLSSRYSFDRVGLNIVNQRFAITPNTYSIQNQQNANKSNSYYPMSNSSTPTGYTSQNNAYVKSFDALSSQNLPVLTGANNQVSNNTAAQQYRNRSLMINLSEAVEAESQDFFETHGFSFSQANSTSHVNSSVMNVSPLRFSKPSKLKQVRNKLLNLKKSDTAVNVNASASADAKRSKSINLANYVEQNLPCTPKSASSYRVFMPQPNTTSSFGSSLTSSSQFGSNFMMNKKRSSLIDPSKQLSNHCELDSDYSMNTIATNSTSSTITTSKNNHHSSKHDVFDDQFATKESKSLRSKISNSRFFQAIGKKFKIFKSSNQPKNLSEYDMDSANSRSHFQINKQVQPSPSKSSVHSYAVSGAQQRAMQRSVTDTIASSYTAGEIAAEIGMRHQPTRYEPSNPRSVSSSTNGLNEVIRRTFEAVEAKTSETDDSAHIFKRNSLHDCLNPRRSFRELTQPPLSAQAPPVSSSYRVISTIAEHAISHHSAGVSSSQCNLTRDGASSKLNKFNSGSVSGNLTGQTGNPVVQLRRPTNLVIGYPKRETCI